MCNPLAVMAVMSVASAAVQKLSADASANQQAKAVKNNAYAAYAANQEQARQQEAQAFEQQTDRARKASEQLAQARVIAAQGGGSLAARAFNIQSGEAEDYSRIDASLSNQLASIRSADAAAVTQTADKLSVIDSQRDAGTAQFVTSIGSAAVSMYGQHVQNTATLDAAKKYTDSKMLAQRGVYFTTHP